MARRCFGLLAAWLLVGAMLAHAADRADWMRGARWGVMNHYLADWRAQVDGVPPSVERWNDLIDHFDAKALAAQLSDVGAGWYQISIGQNSGYYLAPNAAYDRLTRREGPSTCSRRDLVADLSAALAPRGIRLMVYLPSGGPGRDRAAVAALDYQNGPHRNREFQEKWQEIIATWSQRWGSRVSGWWFDGCYWPNAMYRASAAPNFASFAAAARSGNPQSAVAFNPGVVYRTLSVSPDEDFTAGEIDHPEQWTPKRVLDGRVDGAQVHVLSFLGTAWGKGVPRFTTQQVVDISRKVAAAGGVITWDVPVQAGGTIAPRFLEQLAAVNRALRSETPASGSLPQPTR